MENREVKKIGFVFSGGLSRGAAQLSFAKEIIDKIGYDRISIISASSIGALNAYAVGVKSIDKMIDAYSKLDSDTTRQFIKQVRRNLFSKIFINIEGKQIHFPVYVSATKIFSFEPYYYCLNGINRLDVKSAINVSMSFPIINGPLRFNHGVYVDGGATDNIPTYPLNYFDLDMIIILHCYPKYYPSFELFKLKPNTIIVDIDCTLALDKSITSFSLSNDNFVKMIETGKKEGKYFADKVFENFDFNSVRSKCVEYINEKLHDRHVKSGDGLMSFVDVINALYKFKENVN